MMQCKVSQGLKPISEISASNRKNRSQLEDIREFRNDNELSDNPILYFKLRQKAKNAEDFQHNILMSYANTGYSHAFYLAPLTLTKKDYNDALFKSRFYFNDPFYIQDLMSIDQRRWRSYIGSIPHLREHVSIIPHEKVDTHEHYYAFSQNGTDISWHSPEYLEQGPRRLSDIVPDIIQLGLNRNYVSSF